MHHLKVLIGCRSCFKPRHNLGGSLALFHAQIDNGRLVKLLASTKEYSQFAKATFAPNPDPKAPFDYLRSTFLTSAAAAFQGQLDGYLGGASPHEQRSTHKEDIAANVLDANAHLRAQGTARHSANTVWAPKGSEAAEAAELMASYGDVADDLPVEKRQARQACVPPLAC